MGRPKKAKSGEGEGAAVRFKNEFAKSPIRIEAAFLMLDGPLTAAELYSLKVGDRKPTRDAITKAILTPWFRFKGGKFYLTERGRSEYVEHEDATAEEKTEAERDEKDQKGRGAAIGTPSEIEAESRATRVIDHRPN